MPIMNIYGSSFCLPPKVCILAAGPNGRARYKEIPADFCVLAVNKAVLIAEVKADIWMINHAHQDWYAEAHAAFRGIRIYRYEAAMRARPSPIGLDNCYYYKPPEGRLDTRDLRALDDGVLRFGGTIAAAALQLAHHFGGREVLLCGVDMSGNEYWDGTPNRDVHDWSFHGEIWLAVEKLNPLIKYLGEEKGMKISTLSPTKLDVPSYREVL